MTELPVYQHFGTKAGALTELYSEFKARTHVALDAALENAEASLVEVARIIADSYVDCIDEESTELPGVGGALSGSTELDMLRQEADVSFSARCRPSLEPFAVEGAVSDASLYAILDAAEGLTRVLVLKKTTFDEARQALAAVVRSVA